MATVSYAGNLSPYAQIEQYCTSLISVLPSLFESTDTAFRRVEVMKLDEHGDVRHFRHRDATGRVRIVSSITYIEEVRTGDLYKNDSVNIVAMKCLMVVLATPIYTMGKICWYLCQTTIDVSAIVLDTLYKVGQEIVYGRLNESSVEMRHEFSQLSDAIGDGLFEIVKAPIFALGVELVALYGILKPYHGRKFEALIENAWQKGVSSKNDLRNIPQKENCVEDLLQGIRDSRPLYLAYCFQVRGNLSNPSCRLISQESI